MSKVTTYSHIRPRVSEEPVTELKNKRSTENKKGALASLNSKFANFKVMITGGEKRARATVSEPLNKKAMNAELQNIRSKTSTSMSKHNVKGRESQSIKNGPLPSSTKTTPKTAVQLAGPKPMDAQSLRMAITSGLMQAIQSERGSLIDQEDIQKFSSNLSISLGFEQGELTLDQFSALGAMKLEVDPFLPPDVKSNFDAVMLAVEKQLLKDLGMT